MDTNYPRNAVVDFTPHISKLNLRLPWTESRQKALPNVLTDANHPAGAGVGANHEQNKKVEKAAIRVVTVFYEAQGWRVESKESEGRGFDLLCTKGSETKKVEVKGIRGNSVSFVITRGERIAAGRHGDFVLNVVCNALSKKRVIKTWTGRQMEANFDFSLCNI